MATTASDANPFPGMNPFLEQHGRDVHTTLMVYLRDQLQDQLPEGLWATVEEAVTIDNVESSRRASPDVHVSEAWEPPASYTTAPAGRTIAEPLVLLDPDPQTERYVQILEAGGRVITAIEVLSATNKIDPERRRAYRQKRRAYRDGGVNVVEIDLIREGEYLVLAPLSLIPLSRRTPYVVSVWRAADPELKFAYPCSLREPLPCIRIPLREQDADAVIDLQGLMQLCYARGRYHARLDYAQEPLPPLSPSDAAWADALLRAAGLR
jgi:hypothetical protein